MESHQVTDIDLLAEVFDRLDVERRGAIGEAEVGLAFRAVGANMSASKVADVVWEVDGDGDGLLTLDDVEQLYLRAPGEASEFAPARLLNLIEFLMYDPMSTGYITVEDAMHVICRRFRDSLSPALLRKFLLDTQLNPTKRISFRDFVRQVRLRRALLSES